MKKISFGASYLIGGLLVVSFALPAFAANLNGTAGVRIGDNDKKENRDDRGDAKIKINFTAGTDAEIQARASSEIDRRVADLQKLQSRISTMVRLSATAKAALNTTIANEIASLNALKVKINGETGDALKEDAKSITGSYRVYMLAMPQARIIAAADRALTVSGMLTDLSAKLQIRINTRATEGKDVASLQASLADMNAKIADAKIQAQAAISLVSNLTPDLKDKTKITANDQAIASARLKLKITGDDLKSAQSTAKSISKSLKNQ